MVFALTKIDPESRITITPGAGFYDVEYSMGNRNINSIVARLNFTKNVADLAIVTAYKDTRYLIPVTVPPVIANDVYADETYTDSLGEIKVNSQAIKATGIYRLILNPMKCEEKVRLRITPTNLAGTDALVIDINENVTESAQ